MNKVSGVLVANQALSHLYHSYEDEDCHAMVENCVRECGGRMSYAGSNAMARATVWIGTVDEAKQQSRLVPGALTFIHEESGEPAKYQGDGKGNFSHVGLYVGEDALTDVDKRGKERSCCIVHSSSSMGRVAGSTLANGWTHVGWMPEIAYDEMIEDGVTVEEITAPCTVYAENGKPIKLRMKASKTCKTYWLVDSDTPAEMLTEGIAWSQIKVTCQDGYTRTGWMMSEFITRG